MRTRDHLNSAALPMTTSIMSSTTKCAIATTVSGTARRPWTGAPGQPLTESSLPSDLSIARIEGRVSHESDAVRNWDTVGALMGLLDGLAFVASWPSSFPSLRTGLLLLNLPCLAVALRLDGGAWLPDLVPWTTGALTMALIGAVVGMIVLWLRTCLQPDTKDAAGSTAGAEPASKTPRGV